MNSREIANHNATCGVRRACRGLIANRKRIGAERRIAGTESPVPPRERLADATAIILRAIVVAIALGVALFAAEQAFGGERDRITFVAGCTAFVVDGDLLVTAKHCKHPETITVALQGRAVEARKVYETSREDGPVVFRLDSGGKPFESFSIAPQVPANGSRVYTLGFPAGNFARLEGHVLGATDDSRTVNQVDFRIAPGHSGGPLLNAAGEVVGVALNVRTKELIALSGFAGWGVTRDAVARASIKIDGERAPPAVADVPVPPGRYVRSNETEVVVLTWPPCGPCKQLKADVEAGHFPGYRFTFINWDDVARTWDRPELYREFLEATKLREWTGFPTIWIRGTPHYKAGYTGDRGGLLGWLEKLVQGIVESFVGKPRPLFVPQPELGPSSSVDPTEIEEIRTEQNATRITLENALAELAEARETITRTKADYEAFKEGGVITKIKSIAKLRGDKDEVVEHVESLKGTVDELKTQWDEHPFQFLFGLIGLATGLIHRRFAN